MFKARLPLVVLLLGLAGAMTAQATTSVDLVALFEERALLRGPHGQFMLKVGEEKDGVRLLSADPFSASVSLGGQTRKLTLSTHVSSVFEKTALPEVKIPRDSLGQYRIRGAINNSPVHFLVDTGASIVAMSSQMASSVGLDYRTGLPGQVETAQGMAEAHFLNLQTIEVGGIMLHNVKATVIEGHYPSEVLLGMSFLSQVDLSDKSGVLTLSARY